MRVPLIIDKRVLLLLTPMELVRAMILIPAGAASGIPPRHSRYGRCIRHEGLAIGRVGTRVATLGGDEGLRLGLGGDLGGLGGAREPALHALLAAAEEADGADGDEDSRGEEDGDDNAG